MVEVYTDKHTGKDVCSDAYPQCAPFDNDAYKLVAFEVKTSMRVKGEEDFGIAHNQDEDAEGPGEGGAEGSAEKVVDVVDAFQLGESGLAKKEFQGYVLNYVKTALDISNKSTEEKTATQNLLKEMLAKFKDATVYFCEASYEANDPTLVMPIYGYWREGEEAPRLIYFKEGVKTQKY
eukprot:Blabericola_migrator_1__3021@NODE_187_length_11743_cov_250_942275_g162_i0_p7_GENE_NODE_187_length_11743_cov_250_942275_g162_i0NODE_187_length_11743_cov_250_942275_g162_i0_p7_ORF_typecomplete_len178_score41_34TCTP/PF00838_17/2_6e26_NODE_187_length_11743_cov_250_942275_g162_i01100111534